jgi:hypothetical protein
MELDWPFEDDPDTVAFIVWRIVKGETPILLVSHDDDGDWQFLDGEAVLTSDAARVSLANVVRMDPGVVELADLPPGWYARRDAPGSPWTRAEGEPEG